MARNGRQFVNALAQREQRNYQFDFLRPSHSLYPYFNQLVEQYSKVLMPPNALQKQIADFANNKEQVSVHWEEGGEHDGGGSMTLDNQLIRRLIS